MATILKKTWEEYIRPLIRRPDRIQLAALCYRETQDGLKILLITSRGTGRWIIPKGWPMNGMDGAQAALEEAWEEAGVAEGDVWATPLGDYGYLKEIDTGPPVPTRAVIYPVKVVTMRETFPESDQRRRQWFSPEEASKLVDEPELRDILGKLTHQDLLDH
ncbi:NUDIX hydrolase [Qingshengfaniella alkalisoli]|uniref:NUDIX hydrolase n=1 Tax=Qingshengfaniella alkalisoli TaxID=2599296 RepID=A0A5B8I554_9RHOB|nr:NUDIX hydrolase [Qingshengfaniella alkalisoli]QDY68385.1 NUDIX hydrolase [Qingshengfaniella alkalisoli]